MPVKTPLTLDPKIKERAEAVRDASREKAIAKTTMLDAARPRVLRRDMGASWDALSNREAARRILRLWSRGRLVDLLRDRYDEKDAG